MKQYICTPIDVIEAETAEQALQVYVSLIKKEENVLFGVVLRCDSTK